MFEWLRERVGEWLGGLVGGSEETLPRPPREVTDAEGREIRLHALDDADDATVEALVDFYTSFPSDQRAQGTPPAGETNVRKWLDRVLEGYAVVARHGERVVGHVLFVRGGDRGYELAIFVDPDYQRAGIGTELVRTGLGHVQSAGVDYVWLSVERWKPGAQKLYRKTGFSANPMETGATVRMDRRL